MITIYHTRTKNTDKSCLGEFEFDGEKYYTLEDCVRDKKIKHITAIPEGSYTLGLKKVVTPLTQIYRNKYTWFEWHIEIQDVEGYDSVYQHIGNYPKDTDGCQLIGDSHGEDAVWNSTKTFEKYYKKIVPIIESGEEVILVIDNCFSYDG